MAHNHISVLVGCIALLGCSASDDRRRLKSDGFDQTTEYVHDGSELDARFIRIHADPGKQTLKWLEGWETPGAQRSYSFQECAGSAPQQTQPDGSMPPSFPPGAVSSAGLNGGHDLASKFWMFDRENWYCMIFDQNGQPFVTLSMTDGVLVRESISGGKDFVYQYKPRAVSTQRQ